MEEWKNGFFLPQRHREHIEEGMEEFDNKTMEEWKDGRMEDVLPRRHRGHKGITKMEQFDDVIM